MEDTACRAPNFSGTEPDLQEPGRRLALWICRRRQAPDQSAQVIRHPSTAQIVDENSTFVARATR